TIRCSPPRWCRGSPPSTTGATAPGCWASTRRVCSPPIASSGTAVLDAPTPGPYRRGMRRHANLLFALGLAACADGAATLPHHLSDPAAKELRAVGVEAFRGTAKIAGETFDGQT